MKSIAKAQDLMKELTLEVQLQTGPVFFLRQWLGRALIVLAARAFGCGIRIDDPHV